MTFELERQKSFEFYQECLQGEAVAPIDSRIKPLLEHAWEVPWLFPYHSCEGHSMDESRGDKVERLGRRWGNLQLRYLFTQDRKDCLLTRLPGCIQVENSISHDVPRKARLWTDITYKWWYENRDEAITSLFQVILRAENV